MPKLPNNGKQKNKMGKGSSDPGALVFKPKKEPIKVMIGMTLIIYVVVVGIFYGILWGHKKSIQSEIQNKKDQIESLILQGAKEAAGKREKADFYMFLSNYFYEEGNSAKANEYAQKAVDYNPELEEYIFQLN